MMTDNGTFLDREQRLEQVLVECLEELEAGRTADGAALLARYSVLLSTFMDTQVP